LTWSQYIGFTTPKHKIYQYLNGIWNLIDSVDGTTTSYLHQNQQCNVARFYKVSAISNQGFESFSDSISLTPFDTIAPIAPILEYASLINNSTVEVKWTLSPSTDVDRYIVQRKPVSGSWNTLDTLDRFQSSYIDSFIQDIDKVYCYRVRSVDSCNDNVSEWTSTHCIIYLTDTVMGCEQAIRLAFSTYQGTQIDSVTIQRTKNSASEIRLASIDTTSKQYIDTLLTYYDTLCYRIVAWNSGVARWSNQVCNKTYFVDTPTIRYVSKTETGITKGKIELAWVNQTNRPYLQYYTLQIDSGLGWQLIQDSIPISQTSYSLDSINTTHQDYSFRIKVIDSCGTQSEWSKVHKSMNLSFDIGQLLHDLKWTPYEGYKNFNYLVQRSGGGAFATLDTLPSTDTFKKYFPAPCNFNITYRIIALNDNGDFAYSDTIGRVAIDTVFSNPAILRNFTVRDSNHIDFSFRTADSLDVYAYWIMRKDDDGQWFRVQEILNPGLGIAFSSTDTTPTQNVRYEYSIITVDSCLNATPSDTFATIQLKGNPLNLANQLSWHPFKGYPIARYNVELLTSTGWDSIYSTNDTFFTHNNLSCNVERIYRIKGIGVSFITLSDSISLTPFDTIAPTAPIINYASVLSGGRIMVNWNTNPASDTRDYQVYINSQTQGRRLAGTTVTDTTLIAGTFAVTDSTYTLRVNATDTCANNLSDTSISHRVIQLDGQPQNLSNRLAWSQYQGFTTTKHKIYQYLNGGWNLIDSVDGTTTSYLHQNQQCNVARFYKVSAVSNQGFESFSDSISLTPFDTIAPIAPIINFASVLSGGRILVNWNKSPASDTRDYQVYINRQTQGRRLAGTTITDTTLIAGTYAVTDSTYTLRVNATDTCANNLSDTSLTHTVIQLDGQPQNLSNRLTWSQYQGFTTTKHKIYQYLNGIWNLIDSVDGTTTSYLHQNQQCNVARYYKVSAISNQGFESFSDSISLTPFDTIAPPQGKILYATVLDDNRVELVWAKSTATDSREYEISYVTNATNSVTLNPNTITDTNRIINALSTRNNSYDFSLITIDTCAANRSIASIPHRPVVLSGQPKELSNLLTWKAYLGESVSTYEIERLESGTWTSIGSVNGLTLTFTDVPLACNVQKTYRIKANLNNGYSAYSNNIELTPFDTTAPNQPEIRSVTVLENNHINVIWDYDSTSDIKFFEVWRTINDSNPIIIATVIRENSYQDTTSEKPVNQYQYKILAIDSCEVTNRSVFSDNHQASKLVWETGACFPQVRLFWTPYVGFNPEKVEIFRRLPTDTNYQNIATISGADTSYIDNDVDYGLSYIYKVRIAKNNNSQASYSDTIHATPDGLPNPGTAILRKTSVEANGQIRINWSTYSFTKDTLARGYRLYHTNDTTKPYNLIFSTTSETDTNYLHNTNTTQQNFYYVKVYNLCDVEGDSNAIFSPPLIQGNAGNLKIDLNWTEYLNDTSVSKYILVKTINNSTTTSEIDTLLNYSDSNLYCPDGMVNYQILAITNKGDTVSSNINQQNYSDTIPPDIAKMQYVEVLSNNTISANNRLKWFRPDKPNIAKYQIYKSDQTGVYVKIKDSTDANSADFIYQHRNTNPYAGPYSYYIVSEDSCGNFSLPSDTHTTIALTATAQNAYNRVEWTSYQGRVFDGYIIQRRSGSPNWLTLDSFNVIDLAYSDSATKCDTTYSYRILGYDVADNLAVIISNIDTCISYEINPPLEPNLAYVTVSNNKAIDIIWKASGSADRRYYQVERALRGDNNWQVLDNRVQDSVYVDTLVDVKNQSYQYRISTIDSCNNVSILTTLEHTNVNLKLNILNEQLDIVWNNYVGDNIDSVVIYRNGRRFSRLTDTMLSDTTVVCPNYYEYEVRTYFGNYVSLSNRVGGVPIDTTPAPRVKLKVASVSQPNIGIDISWKKSKKRDAAGYILSRSPWDGTRLQEIYRTDNVNDTFYSDVFDENISLNYCYTVSVIDSCGNISETSNLGCNMYLTAKVENKDGNSLNWTPYQLWQNGVSYYRIMRKLGGGQYQEIGQVDGNTTTYTDQDFDFIDTDSFCYQVEAHEVFGNRQISRSTVSCVVQQPIIWIPNAFSPTNFDGINDVFKPQGQFIKRYTMNIYNRWGAEIHSTENSEGWDGKFKGAQVPEGVYMYWIEVESHDQKKYRFKGSLVVL
jgi:gliding motility-associated-like protein